MVAARYFIVSRRFRRSKQGLLKFNVNLGGPIDEIARVELLLDCTKSADSGIELFTTDSATWKQEFVTWRDAPRKVSRVGAIEAVQTREFLREAKNSHVRKLPWKFEREKPVQSGRGRNEKEARIKYEVLGQTLGKPIAETMMPGVGWMYQIDSMIKYILLVIF